ANAEFDGQRICYAQLSEEDKVTVLRRELTQVRPLVSPWLTYSDETEKELAILRMAARCRDQFGEDATRQSIVSHTETLSDLLEVLVLQQETGLIHPVIEHEDATSAEQPESTHPSQGVSDGLMVVPLFETIPDLERGPEIMAQWLD